MARSEVKDSMTVLARSLVLWRRYESALHAKPMRTQILTSAVLWGIGDVCAQRIDGTRPHNKQRTLATAGYGACVIGPVGHIFYEWLDRAVKRMFLPATPSFVAAKVLGDALIFGPVHVAGFFAWMIKAEGGSWEDVAKRIKQDFIPTFAAECTYWPLIQGTNFYRVPVQHQLLVVNLACLGDSTFLSWAKAQDDWVSKLPLPESWKRKLPEDPPLT